MCLRQLRCMCACVLQMTAPCVSYRQSGDGRERSREEDKRRTRRKASPFARISNPSNPSETACAGQPASWSPSGPARTYTLPSASASRAVAGAYSNSQTRIADPLPLRNGIPLTPCVVLCSYSIRARQTCCWTTVAPSRCPFGPLCSLGRFSRASGRHTWEGADLILIFSSQPFPLARQCKIKPRP